MKKIVYFCFGLLAAISLSVAVAQNTQVLLGIGVGNDGTSSEVTDKASGDVLTAGEFNRLIRILRGFILDPAPDGRPRYVIGADGSSGVQNVGGGVLTVDVEGKLGATEYCDGDGGNCKAFEQLGAGGGRGLYVGSLSTKTGATGGGYQGLDALCETSFDSDNGTPLDSSDDTDVSARVCTIFDIIHTKSENIGVLPTTGQHWIFEGPPGDFVPVNDCKGFTANDNGAGVDYYGSVYNFDLDTPAIRPCGSATKVACCSN
jgi:hypothetical protein